MHEKQRTTVQRGVVGKDGVWFDHCCKRLDREVKLFADAKLGIAHYQSDWPQAVLPVKS